MQSERVELEVTTPRALELFSFHVPPRKFLGDKCDQYLSIKQGYIYLDVLPNAVFLNKVKAVLGQENKPLLSAVEYKKGHKNELAVRNKVGLKLNIPLSKLEVANVMLQQLRVIWHQ